MNHRHTLLSAAAIIALQAATAHAQAQAPAQPAVAPQAADESIGPAPAAAATQRPQSTQAPSQSGALQEIVVTAQKRSENLQNVPISVSVATAGTLGKAGVTELTDLSVVVPGLNVTNTYGRLTPSLRGIGSTSVGPGVENPIALYIDGVYYAGTTASLLSLNNISQIAVLKGPQGTLFGRNATGGLIQVTTPDPTQTPSGEFQLSQANYNATSGSAYLSGGLADGVAADIAIYAKHQSDGWGEDLTTGRDIYTIPHDVSVRSKFVLTPSDGTKLTAIADYENVRDTTLPTNIRPGSISPFEPGSQPDTGYDTRANVMPLHTMEGGGASLLWNQDVGNIKLSSTTAYRKSKAHVDGDLDVTQLDMATAHFGQSDHQFTEELQLNSHPRSKLIWAAGLFYFDAVGGYEQVIEPLNYAGIIYRVPLAKQGIRSTAAYAQATNPITDATNLTAGIRFTHETHRLYDASVAIDPIGAPGSATALQAPEVSRTDNKPTWRLSLDHRFSPQLLLYASYNRGFKAGGYNAASPTAPGYKPEVLDAFELGAKTDLFDRHVRLNVSGFYYDYSDIQVNQFTSLTIETTNGAKAQSYGVEADLTASLTEGLQFTSGLSVIRPTFKSYPNCVVSAPNGGVPLFTGNCTGYELPLASRFTANSALDYTFDVGNGNINLNGNLYYNQGFYTDIPNNIHQREYLKAAASVTWTSSSQRLSIRAFGTNLTNRRVLTYGDSQGIGTMLVGYAEPRTYGATLIVKY